MNKNNAASQPRTRSVRTYRTLRRSLCMPPKEDAMVLKVVDAEGVGYSEAVRLLIRTGYREWKER